MFNCQNLIKITCIFPNKCPHKTHFNTQWEPRGKAIPLKKAPVGNKSYEKTLDLPDEYLSYGAQFLKGQTLDLFSLQMSAF
jgi:hypothetical protein